jgi:hypothetical protein
MSVREQPQPVSADRELRDALEKAQGELSRVRALVEQKEREKSALEVAVAAAEQKAARIKQAAIGAALGFPENWWEPLASLLIGGGLGAALMYWFLR